MPSPDVVRAAWPLRQDMPPGCLGGYAHRMLDFAERLAERASAKDCPELEMLAIELAALAGAMQSEGLPCSKLACAWPDCN